MRIAQLTRMLPRSDYAGGVSGQVDLLARALAVRGHDVTVFATNPPADSAPYEFRAVTMPRDGRGLIGRATPYLFPFRIARLPLDDFDVIHCHGDDHLIRTSRPLLRTFYGSSLGEARTGATMRHRLYHLSMAWPEKISERRATHLAVISASTQHYLKRQASVIPCAYDGSRFFPGGVKSARPSILFVGDLDTRKRGRLLLDVFSRIVRPAMPNAELWIVSADRPQMPGVRAMGRLPGHDLANLYRQAWVFCLPSRYEGFGVPYVEAMACGTAVVATRNGGADEVLDGGRHGLLVDDGALGTALISVLQSADARRDLAARALMRARTYTADRVSAQYEALYDSMVRR